MFSVSLACNQYTTGIPSFSFFVDASSDSLLYERLCTVMRTAVTCASLVMAIV